MNAKATKTVVTVSELRSYGELRASKPNSKGFENLSQLTDAQIVKIVGDADTVRKAHYRLSGVVGMSVTYSMQKDWAELTSNKEWNVKKTEATSTLRRYQVSKIV